MTNQELQDVLKMEREANVVLRGRVNELQAKLAEFENVEPMPELVKCATFTEAAHKPQEFVNVSKELFAQIRQERDHFKAAYARKLDEHSATLADAMQLCKERDEASEKLAEFGVVMRCQNCGGTGKDARGSDCCRIPGHAKECACFTCQWKNAFYGLERESNEERAKLAATEAHCATLRAALVDAAEIIIPMSKDPGCHSPKNFDEKQAVYIAEHHGFGNLMNIFSSKWYAKVRGGAFAVGPCISTAASVNRTIQAALAATPADSLAQVREQVRAEILPVVQEAAAGLDPEAVALINEGGMLLRAKIRREAIREWCEAIQDEAITSWLDHTPEPLGPGDLLKRLLFAAGRDRAVRELRSKAITFRNLKKGDGNILDRCLDNCAECLEGAAIRIEMERDEIAKEGK